MNSHYITPLITKYYSNRTSWFMENKKAINDSIKLAAKFPMATKANLHIMKVETQDKIINNDQYFKKRWDLENIETIASHLIDHKNQLESNDIIMKKIIDINNKIVNYETIQNDDIKKLQNDIYYINIISCISFGLSLGLLCAKYYK